MVSAAIEAADRLSDSGITYRILNMATIKPLDESAIVDAARDTGAIVTAEEHYITGGLGTHVSQVLARELPTPVEMVALRGYAESGTPEQLLAKYHLTADDVSSAARKAISRKSS